MKSILILGFIFTSSYSIYATLKIEALEQKPPDIVTKIQTETEDMTAWQCVIDYPELGYKNRFICPECAECDDRYEEGKVEGFNNCKKINF